jgi:hypothetical protein
LKTGKRDQKTDLTGRSPLRRGKSALDCIVIEEDEDEEEEKKKKRRRWWFRIQLTGYRKHKA